jgi:DNA processing protein
VLSDETRALLTLHLLPGVGPRLTAALMERFGSAAATLRARAEQLRQVPHIGEKLAGQIAEALQRMDVDAELAEMDRHQVRLLLRGSPEYHASLAQLDTAPFLLCICGTLQDRDHRAIAVVGSRQCTGYGKRMAERLAGDLVRGGFTVVSGLARGIDGFAHRGALQAGGRTLAVLAGGLSKIYPPEHTDLAGQVQESGALLSESTMKQEPLPGMFPARNRIISGLSLGVVIVEANDKSGALITARHAAEQGRPVFAVPGALDNPASAGCHRLIRQGAILIRSVDDILEELQGTVATTSAASRDGQAAPTLFGDTPAEPPGLEDRERRVWQCLLEKPRHLDEMVESLGLGVAELSGLLMMMEMKRVVRRLPGNRYERC